MNKNVGVATVQHRQTVVLRANLASPLPATGCKIRALLGANEHLVRLSIHYTL